MKNFFKKAALLSVVSLSAVAVQAQFKARPTSRFLLDYASLSSKDVPLRSGLGVRDFRMGLKATYEKYYFKADISFAGAKITMKDMYAQYNINKHSFVRLGHYTIPFGLSSAYSSSYKQFMQEPSANAFQIGRGVGIMNSLWNKNLWAAYGAFADNSILKEPTNVSGHQGIVLGGRFVYRPINEKGRMLQAGLSYNYRTAPSAGIGQPRSLRYKMGYLNSVDKTLAVNALIDNVKYEHRYTAELAGFCHNFCIESQYYNTHVFRNNSLKTYRADGFYAVARCIVVNPSDYSYNDETAGINHPKNNQLEVGLGYSYLNTNDKTANIYGGKMQDVSLGLSYYVNKYVTLRGNYSYITATPSPTAKKIKANALQFRVQYYF